MSWNHIPRPFQFLLIVAAVVILVDHAFRSGNAIWLWKHPEHQTQSSNPLSYNSINQQHWQPPFPLVQVPVAKPDHPSTVLHTFHGQLSRTVYLLNTTEPFQVDAPYKNNASFRLERVLSQARRNKCEFATNGGPFHNDGSTAGSLVINGTVVVNDFGGAVGFGITKAPQRFVLGSVSEQDVQTLSLAYYTTGFDWLVYNHKNVVSGSRKKPAHISTTKAEQSEQLSEQAPRTAVGVDALGHLYIMVADGCELCWKNRGPTLGETADFLARQGLKYAVNMDGGSSSTMTRRGRVVNKPTCLDIDLVTCSRPVASVLCIKKQQAS